MRKFGKLFVPALLALFIISGCNDEDQMARLRITLVDDPGDYEKVNVDIQGVSVHVSDQPNEEDNGWVDFPDSNVGVKNLLEFTSGKELTLVDTEFPTGKISQVRLHLGEQNSVVIDNVEHPLETPSGQQSGLKLQVHETLLSGVTYEIKLDFEAARSVVHTGSDKYILKPVIKVITESKSGAIKGSIMPSDEIVAIYVIDNDDTVATSYSNMGISEFLVPDVPEGIFVVSFDPGAESGLEKVNLEDVEVVIGQVTDVGLIELPQSEETTESTESTTE